MSTVRRQARVRGRLLVVATIVAFVTVAGCGLPKDSSPREIAADKVPFGLIGPSTTTQSNEIVEGGSPVHLYFVDGARLRPVNRMVARRDPRLVLDALVKGVSDTDPLGIASSIPKDTKIVDIQPDGNDLVVTLSNEMLNVQSTEQRNAFAQLVYTASDLGVPGVRFRVLDTNGNPQDVLPPTDQGPHSGPLTRSDYDQEAPG